MPKHDNLLTDTTRCSESENDSKNYLTLWIRVKHSNDSIICQYQLVNGSITEQSVQKFLENVNFMKTEKNRALFWSAPRKMICTLTSKSEFWKKHASELHHSPLGFVPFENIAQVIADQLGLTTISDVAKAHSIDIDKLKAAQWRLLSAPYAKHASGIAFAAIQDNYITYKKSTWANVELPALMKNENIDMIVGLNFLNPYIVKDIWLPNGINTEALKTYCFPLPMTAFSDEVKSKFPNKEKVTAKQLYDKFKGKKIHVNPLKISYNADATIDKCVSVNERGTPCK